MRVIHRATSTERDEDNSLWGIVGDGLRRQFDEVEMAISNPGKQHRIPPCRGLTVRQIVLQVEEAKRVYRKRQWNEHLLEQQEMALHCETGEETPLSASSTTDARGEDNEGEEGEADSSSPLKLPNDSSASSTHKPTEAEGESECVGSLDDLSKINISLMASDASVPAPVVHRTRRPPPKAVLASTRGPQLPPPLSAPSTDAKHCPLYNRTFSAYRPRPPPRKATKKSKTSSLVEVVLAAYKRKQAEGVLGGDDLFLGKSDQLLVLRSEDASMSPARPPSPKCRTAPECSSRELHRALEIAVKEEEGMVRMSLHKQEERQLWLAHLSLASPAKQRKMLREDRRQKQREAAMAEERLRRKKVLEELAREKEPVPSTSRRVRTPRPWAVQMKPS